MESALSQEPTAWKPVGHEVELEAPEVNRPSLLESSITEFSKSTTVYKSRKKSLAAIRMSASSGWRRTKASGQVAALLRKREKPRDVSSLISKKRPKSSLFRHRWQVKPVKIKGEKALRRHSCRLPRQTWLCEFVQIPIRD